MSFKWVVRIIVVGLVLMFLFSNIIYAQELEQEDAALNERIELIQASQRITQGKKEAEITRTGLSLFVTNFHTDNTELKLGGKFEQQLFGNSSTDRLNDLSWSYVIDGIYLEGETEPLAGFLSLKATLNNRMFSPYFGAGAEFMGVANYQGFVGLNINKNFFVETKFINDQDEWDSGDFYSVTGFKINF